MVEKESEEREAQLWELGESDSSITVEDIIYLVETGFKTCEDFCESRYFAGEGRCSCIRETFPTPEHYKLYERLRKDYGEIFHLLITAKALDELIKGNRNDNE